MEELAHRFLVAAHQRRDLGDPFATSAGQHHLAATHLYAIRRAQTGSQGRALLVGERTDKDGRSHTSQDTPFRPTFTEIALVSVNKAEITAARDRSFPLLGTDGQDHRQPDQEAASLTKRGPQRQFPILTLDDLATVGQVRPEVLIAGKIMQRSLTITYGDSDTGKSYYAQDTCFALAATGVSVWYIAAEGFDGFYLRTLAWRD